MPRGSDESWIGKLNEKCSKYQHYEKSRFGTTCKTFSFASYIFVRINYFIKFFLAAFIIKHFSDTVKYTSNGFLEKNRDTISKELVNVLRDSDLSICRKLMSLSETVDQHENNTMLGGRVKINAAKHLVRI